MAAYSADANSPTDVRAALERDLSLAIAFQRKWKTISMTGYVVTAVGSLGTSTAASLLAAFDQSIPAAICAAISTLLIGIEKTMLFREKWKFHLSTYTRMKVLATNLTLSRVSVDNASDQFASLLGAYATELPIASREQ